MSRKGVWLTVGLVTASAMVAMAQRGQPATRTPGRGAMQDPNRAAFVAANCTKEAPPPRTDPTQQGPAWFGPTNLDVTTKAIPGVIAAGQKWKLLYEDKDTNADGLIGLEDGSILFTEDRKNRVMRIDKDGKSSVAYEQTYMSGALAANRRGQLFLAERALDRDILLLKPERRVFANKMDGQPLECYGGGINDLSADSKGGVYFTMGGVYYANPQGVVSGPYGTNPGNGLILSPDEKTLYVSGRLKGATPPANAAGLTGGASALDVQADGTLTNERQFAWYGGDSMAVDKDGRVYLSFPPGGFPKGSKGRGADGNDAQNGVPFDQLGLRPEYSPAFTVLSPKGELLGAVPVPRTTIQVTFGRGPNNTKVMYALTIHEVQVYSIPMIAEGLKDRSH